MNPILATTALALAHVFNHGAHAARPMNQYTAIRVPARPVIARPYAAPVYARPVLVRHVDRFGHEMGRLQRAERIPGARVPFVTHRAPRW